ncbi:NVEALA domain-containing protein [Proteiniphilum propionicum]|jgi:hypothetical protein|uniref:NVEALA domain-containing protein n=1 Tax=Proteiniphilum propionicum TaxID=2829812 RepID=UPI001EEC1E16|nr:NVEALA domain-containing protein [Proteiniphilum propionicum]ULB33753.1 NVEALA domain-containing protein [Proteiniphilum propionicum]ULB33785.1 NVEALA domain-containing protein [Proteiniphilum propionicum]ULB35535.1 NVEALA domain-containing protein [Proteiniphilum propionicum]
MKKKKVILSLFMAVSVLSLVYLKSQRNGIKSELVLSNIEALASGEDGENYRCLGLGSLDCPQISTKVAFIRIL